MIIGIDHGYSYIKTSRGIIFPSTVTKGEEIDFNKGSIRVEIDGEKYIVGGSSGQMAVDINKVESNVTKVCTFAAVGKSVEYQVIEADLVVGLPVGYYSKQKEEFKNMILSYGRKDIIINKYKQSIKIRRVEVFPQSAGLVFTNPGQYEDKNILIIDIGGMTVDVSHFRGMKLEKYSTYTSGMLKLYAKLAQILNNKFEVNYKSTDIDEIIRRKKVIIDGQPYQIDFIEDAINEHINEFVSIIKTEYPVRIVDNIVLIGGGAIRLKENMEKHLKNIHLAENAQFSNAKYFYNIGRMKFHE